MLSRLFEVKLGEGFDSASSLFRSGCTEGLIVEKLQRN